jgi:uncharacterized protein (TIGR00255 family)
MAEQSQRSPKSMTGFAQARAEQNGWALRLTLRTVNHRFLDIHLRLPEGFEPLEPRIRQRLRERLRRGHVDMAVHFEAVGSAAVQVNRDVAAAYLKTAADLRREFGVKTEPDLAAILRLPGVIGATAAPLAEDMERLGEQVVSCLDEALANLDRMRQSEGRVLAEELVGRLEKITSLANEIEVLAERARPAYARRLEARLKELLGDTPLDPARLAMEAAMAAERSDVSEELSRLRSHVLHFGEMLAAENDVGKKLDFLLQEMQREANTLLAKTPGNDADGMAITRLALEVKSEIEKLREQVQNIE